ncbi:glycoside hydrolase family 3 protein [Paenibacillus foliorum]|nr:glycoside hydrolase family 3 protein [Paenibacillus foliorum]
MATPDISVPALWLASSFNTDIFQYSFLTNGFYFKVEDDGKLIAGTDVAAFNQNPDCDDVDFTEVVLQQPGSNSQTLKIENDYNIVIVGAAPRIVTGESIDRPNLNLGTQQAELVHNVAQQFPGKTIVVIKSESPLAVDDIQNDPNVSAILYYGYSGQYENKALAEALFGGYAPAGRLTSDWLKDISSLPKLSPEVQATVDPRYTVDMTNADPLEAKLTYRYSDATPTYAFGYGLTYTTFAYSDLRVRPTVNANGTFDVNLKVINTGNNTSDEVVQLYVHSRDSAYGSYVPKKQLAAFKRVGSITPGETRDVTLTVDPHDFAVWDVNKQKYMVESGRYDLFVGRSSDNILLTSEITVNGETIGSLDLKSKAKNLWDHTYVNNGVIGSEVSKARTALYQGEYYAVTSTKDGDYVGIPNVNMNGAKGLKLRVASTSPTSSIEVRADSPTGTKLGTITFHSTAPVEYDIGGGKTAKELGYTDATGAITQVSGDHNLYLVFRGNDIRVDSIKLLASDEAGK